MQAIEIENTLNLSPLPASAQQELIDFYEFLLNKYTEKQNTTQFVKPLQKNTHSLKGVFNQYANPSKMAMEKTAWQNHFLNKYRHD